MHGRLICGTHADRVIASNFAFELSLPELSLFPSLRATHFLLNLFSCRTRVSFITFLFSMLVTQGIPLVHLSSLSFILLSMGGYKFYLAEMT